MQSCKIRKFFGKVPGKRMFQFSDYGLSVDVVLLGAIAAILILLILCLILIGKNSSLRKRYDEFMRDSDGKSLEEAFQKKFTNMDYINGKIKEVDEHLAIIDENLLKTYQKVGVVKYDAFKEVVRKQVGISPLGRA